MERKENDYFYGILSKGEVIQRDSLEALRDFDGIKYYLYARYDNTYKGPVNTTKWYQYKPIDENGNPVNLKVGDFEVKSIGTDSGCTNFFGRNIEIFDIRKKALYNYTSLHYGVDFLFYELIPLLEKINDLGSWEAYLLGQNFLKLKADYEELEQKYNQLETAHAELKKTLINIVDSF